MGKSHVRHFVAEGARVVFGDVRDDQGAAVAAKLGEQSCRYTHHDVTSETTGRPRSPWRLRSSAGSTCW